MPPWFERDQPAPFDRFSITGRRDLNGDDMALKYRQSWAEGKKYPIIHFSSEVEREITTGGGEQQEPHVHVFGNLELPYHCTRDEAFQHILPIAKERRYIVGRIREQVVRIDNPDTGRGYVITFDNDNRRIENIELFPEYAMDLMPGEVRAILPPLYSQEQRGLEAIAPIKYFTPDSSWTWYPTEFDGDDLMFGLASGFEVELGYFTLRELESVRGGLGLPIERDLYYQPQTLKQIQAHEQQLKR